jgi:hypothetical protein
MTSRTWGPPVVLLVTTAAIFEGIAVHGASPVRTLLVVCFLAIAPGLALVGLLGLSDAWLEASLVPALSLSIDAIVGGALSYSGLWSPTTAMVILVALSLIGAAGQVVLRRSRTPR